MKTVAIIDDSEEDRYLVRRALRRSKPGVGFVEYDSAFHAVEDFLDEQSFQANVGKPPPPVLVLLDINMPRMNGFEFLERLEKEGLANNPYFVVMMFTSSNDPKERARAEASPLVVDYIVKPITKEQMAAIGERPEFKLPVE
ncbi:MAG: response regulator [Sandaracinaceae bacterium]